MPCHVFPARILHPIICACARTQVTVVCYILLLWLEAKVQIETVNSLPFLVGTEQEWAGQRLFKIVNFAFTSLGIYKKSVISQGTNNCSSCSHGEYLPSQGTRECNCGYPNSLVLSEGSLGTGHSCCFCSLTQYSQRSHVMSDVSVSC